MSFKKETKVEWLNWKHDQSWRTMGENYPKITTSSAQTKKQIKLIIETENTIMHLQNNQDASHTQKLNL